jgi:hypothetical protein
MYQNVALEKIYSYLYMSNLDCITFKLIFDWLFLNIH